MAVPRPCSSLTLTCRFVDLAAMPDVMQMDLPRRDIELVEHPVVADAQSEFRPAAQAPVREVFQSRTHLVDLLLNSGTHLSWKCVKSTSESRRPDLEGGGHASSRLTCGVVTVGDLPTRLIEAALHLVRKLKLVFEVFVDPRTKRFDFFTPQSRNSRLNLVDRTHAGILTRTSGKKSKDLCV